MGCEKCKNYMGCKEFLKTAFPEYQKVFKKTEKDFMTEVFIVCNNKDKPR